MPFYIRVTSLITPVHCITQTEEPKLSDTPLLKVGLIHSPNLILFLLPLIAYEVSKAQRFEKFSDIYSEKSTKNVAR
jgi:hypothetical protein